MKYIIFFSAITLFSCSKESNNPDPQQSVAGSVQYKINGTSVVYDNVDYAAGQYALVFKQLKGTVLPETRYLLEAQKGLNNVLLFPIVTDSLHQTIYHLDSTSTYNNMGGPFLSLTMFNGVESALFFSGDYFDVNITSYKNSRITGTFSAKFTPFKSSGIDYSQRGTTVITEGKINNVQVIY